MAVILIVFAIANLILDIVIPPPVSAGSMAYVPTLAWALAIMLALASYMLSRLGAAYPLLVGSYLLTLLALFIRIPITEGVTPLVVTLITIALLFVGAFGRIVYAVASIVIVATIFYIFTDDAGWMGQPVYSLSFVVPFVISAFIWRPFESAKAREASQVAQLEEQLDTESAKAKSVIQAITDGVMYISQEGIIELSNPAAAAMTGWSQQDSTGLQYETVVKLASEKGIEYEGSSHPIYQVLTKHQPLHSDNIELVTAKNKKITISLTITPLGKQEGVILVFRNVTDEMRENREKAEFISTASHEMRTPVASIEGYLGLVLNPQTATIDEKARQYVLKAHEAAQHLGRLFQDLLDITRAEDGRLSNNPVVLNITDTIREHTQQFKNMAAEKGLDLVFEPDVKHNSSTSIAPVYFAKVDRDHLRELISNLIENAIKYTPAGSVVIDVGGDNKNVTISVKDSGIGIAEEDVPHIFQKFYRIDNSDTREIGGTGLGLYLCRRLAESMDGKLWVESARGEGSQFFLELARVPADQVAMEPKKVADEPQQPVEPTAPQQPVTIAPQPAPTAPQPVPQQQPAPAPQPQPQYPPQQPQVAQALQTNPAPQQPTQPIAQPVPQPQYPPNPPQPTQNQQPPVQQPQNTTQPNSPPQ